MVTIATPYTGTLDFWVRSHTASDYLLYIEDEETREYSAFKIDASATTYERGVLEINASLTLTEGRRYVGYIFPQDGSLTDSTGTTESWWNGFLTLLNAGSIESDIVRFMIYCTNQTDKQRFAPQDGEYTAYSKPNDDKVITYGG